VIVPGKLSLNIIHIKVGDALNTEGLLLKLSDYGFERTDFVYEPGQFAIRGGILDIYSFGNDKPYRIELFGNDVDSIRIVDPETQLSERKLLQVSIIPNVDTQFETEERVSLLDFLPENTVVWLQDHDWCKERLVDCEDDLDIFLRREGNNEKPKDNNDDRLIKKNVTADDFISAKEFEEKILHRHFVEFSYQPSSIGHNYEIEFNTKQQPAFNRQFDLLIRDLKHWEKTSFNFFFLPKIQNN
jgi:transcription-repair coupling factor (superfamily II helicase)